MVVSIPPMAQNIEMAWKRPEIRRMFDRFATFSRFVHFDKRGTGASDFAELGTSAGEPTLPEPGPIDPARVAEVNRAHGIEVLGAPPQPLT